MLFVVSIKNFKKLNYHTYIIRIVLSIICSKCKDEDEKIPKNKNQLKYEKFLG